MQSGVDCVSIQSLESQYSHHVAVVPRLAKLKYQQVTEFTGRMEGSTIGPCRPFFCLPPRQQRPAKPKAQPKPELGDETVALQVLRSLLLSSHRPPLPEVAGLQAAISDGEAYAARPRLSTAVAGYLSDHLLVHGTDSDRVTFAEQGESIGDHTLPNQLTGGLRAAISILNASSSPDAQHAAVDVLCQLTRTPALCERMREIELPAVMLVLIRLCASCTPPGQLANPNGSDRLSPQRRSRCC